MFTGNPGEADAQGLLSVSLSAPYPATSERGSKPGCCFGALCRAREGVLRKGAIIDRADSTHTT